VDLCDSRTFLTLFRQAYSAKPIKPAMPDAKALDEYLKAANHVLEHAKDIPKVLFTGCAGILLLKATEAGFVFSGKLI
jgi:hypothetical protein